MRDEATDEQVFNDNDDFEEIDLNPHEDDDDATLHRKLVAAKLARKRAEEDLKLLCNRIGLLKFEEGKVRLARHLPTTGSEEDRRDTQAG